ncbi:hypothetical protein TREMEDRAFT_64204 [Tremella mesenterica DSM 1558]|uniref:uncharacterized protein n=1 Tax=Tremella mesenterica (strain ATCC 24925 / CBS 8224 / DSM 1558 / NBRC 9311 / NRRL Y-6157 / RJB 2259-6 / UBC 559-6) TaxID=578456 RepID=UPI0003F49156|nr:uncharacterized protein TREMEDRAFT_64204 [Tremella mesenterica DSM 1558]EIW67613.1 hypothetical protein TREMEDRAFT_64204 [Tremella mesenterica DSM 1558]
MDGLWSRAKAVAPSWLSTRSRQSQCSSSNAAPQSSPTHRPVAREKSSKKRRRASPVDPSSSTGGLVVTSPEVKKTKRSRKKAEQSNNGPTEASLTAGPSTMTSHKKGKKKAPPPLSDDVLRRLLRNEEHINAYLCDRWIKPAELNRLESEGILTYKRGKFDEDEQAAVRSYFDNFKSINKLGDEELLEIIMAKGENTERKEYPKFWPQVAANLPGRPVKYVKDMVQRMYDPLSRQGIWSEEQEATLLRFHPLYPGSWVKLGEEVGRSALDCRDKWQKVRVTWHDHIQKAWTEEETNKLNEAVKKVVTVEKPMSDWDWEMMARIMGGVRPTAIYGRHWKTINGISDRKGKSTEKAVRQMSEILPEVRAGAVVEKNVVSRNQASDKSAITVLDKNQRMTLINRIKKQSVTSSGDINWTSLVKKKLATFSPDELKMVWEEMQKEVDPKMKMKLSRVLKRLKRRYEEMDSEVIEKETTEKSHEEPSTVSIPSKEQSKKRKRGQGIEPTSVPSQPAAPSGSLVVSDQVAPKKRKRNDVLNPSAVISHPTAPSSSLVVPDQVTSKKRKRNDIPNPNTVPSHPAVTSSSLVVPDQVAQNKGEKRRKTLGGDEKKEKKTKASSRRKTVSPKKFLSKDYISDSDE